MNPLFPAYPFIFLYISVRILPSDLWSCILGFHLFVIYIRSLSPSRTVNVPFQYFIPVDLACWYFTPSTLLPVDIPPCPSMYHPDFQSVDIPPHWSLIFYPIAVDLPLISANRWRSMYLPLFFRFVFHTRLHSIPWAGQQMIENNDHSRIQGCWIGVGNDLPFYSTWCEGPFSIQGASRIANFIVVRHLLCHCSDLHVWCTYLGWLNVNHAGLKCFVPEFDPAGWDDYSGYTEQLGELPRQL